MHVKTSCLTWHDGRRAASRHRTAAPRQAGSWRRPATQTFPGLRAEVRLLREVAGLSQHLASHPPSSLRHTDRLAHEMMSRCRRSIIGRRSREGAGAQRRAVLLPPVGQGVRTQYVVVLTRLSVRRCRQDRKRAPADVDDFLRSAANGRRVTRGRLTRLELWFRLFATRSDIF